MWKNSSKTRVVAFIGQKGFPPEFPGTSGIEIYVEIKAHELRAQKKLVICYTRRWVAKNNNNNDGILVRPLPTIYTKHLDTITYSFLATIHAIAMERADTIWYQGIGPGLFAFLPKLFGRRVILTIHALDWKRKKWGWFAQSVLRGCEKLSIASADTIYVVSHKIQQHIASTYHKDTVVDQLVLSSQKRPGKHLAQKFLRAYTTKPFHYILFMGRFVPEKRIEWVIRAFRELHAQNLHLVLAGGQSHTPSYERRAKLLARGNRRIHFPGYVFGKEKSMLLSYAKLLVLPSETEGFPVVVTEALQYKTPCLVPDFLKGEYPLNKPVHYFKHDSYEDFFNMFKRLTRDSSS